MSNFTSPAEVNQQFWDDKDALFCGFIAVSTSCDTTIEIDADPRISECFEGNERALASCQCQSFEVFAHYVTCAMDGSVLDDHMISIGLMPRIVVLQMFAFHAAIQRENAKVSHYGNLWNDASDLAASERAKRTVETLRSDISKKYATTFLSILRRDGSACRICGQPSPDLQIDHIQPVTRGGGNDFANLQLLCPTCNSAKRNHWLEEGGAE